jgi:hypothetical protein
LYDQAEAFVDPGDKEGLPEVFDDFDLEASMFSEEWRRSVQNSENLKRWVMMRVVMMMMLMIVTMMVAVVVVMM